MISLSECVDLSGLSEEEVEILATHRHIPHMAAAQLGYSLLQTPKGIYELRSIYLEALEQAKLAGQQDRARRVDRVLTAFIAAHPTPRVL